MTKEEAIDKVRAMKLSPGKDAELIIALHTLIPELRESEDERIRKEIISLVLKVMGQEKDNLSDDKYDAMLAWLEKQKESKKEFHIPDYIGMAHYNPVPIEQKEQKPSNLPAGFYYIDLNGNRYYSKEFRYGDMKLKVGEQKPVLTAKEAWKEMRLEVYAQASGNRHEPNYSDDSTKMFSLCDIDEIFEKIGNSTVEQKPAEWSEEDKEALDMCLDVIPKKWKTKSGILLTKWLKDNIHPQPKQEWSEEDERMLSRCEKSIESSKQFADSDTFKKAKDNEIDWLENRFKSLRPSWKPSEDMKKPSDIVLKI